MLGAAAGAVLAGVLATVGPEVQGTHVRIEQTVADAGTGTVSRYVEVVDAKGWGAGLGRLVRTEGGDGAVWNADHTLRHTLGEEVGEDLDEDQVAKLVARLDRQVAEEGSRVHAARATEIWTLRIGVGAICVVLGAIVGLMAETECASRRMRREWRREQWR